MRNYFLPFAMIALSSLLLISCEDEDAPEEDAPDAAFSATEGSSTNSTITINFTDNSSNSPSEWYWTFEGGTPTTSTESNPTVTYTAPGTFDVTLEVTNDGGSNQVTMTDYINIVKFLNPTQTEIDITINNKDKTIPVDDYVLFASIDNTTVNFNAEASGTTNSGDIIGLPISWEGSANLNEYSAWNLNVSSDFVFFYVTNSGTDNLTPFYVNYGTDVETEDNIVIENNENATPTGYYYANSGMEVRAYFESSPATHVHWDEGDHFTLPWELNQSKNLGNTNKTTKEPEKEKVLDPNVGNIFQIEVK
ncbi:MAG: PKD domain-containing protein [Bacteroidota bacterium]|nr:PKD domain-containing protein [Bacteroidota bacterium]